MGNQQATPCLSTVLVEIHSERVMITMAILYQKSQKYLDELETIYAECSGPGGLQLTEFMAEKMGLRPNVCVLDIGIEHGYQTCFLAKEYGVQVIGLDPDDDRSKGEAKIIQQDGGRWLTYGYVIARKPD